MKNGWEHFYHQADIGLRATGDSLPQLYARLATALTAVITDPALVKPAAQIEISVAAPDPELLLVDWLNALVSEISRRQMLFCTFEISVSSDWQLQAVLRGEKIDLARHAPAVEVKGATYSELICRQEANGQWLGQVVVDV